MGDGDPQAGIGGEGGQLDLPGADPLNTIHRLLRRRCFKVIRWGGDYTSRKDGMHFEINASWDAVGTAAKRCKRTRRGPRILRANPGFHGA